MELNINKCKLTRMTREFDLGATYRLDNTFLELVEPYKYPGVILSCNFAWNLYFYFNLKLLDITVKYSLFFCLFFRGALDIKIRSLSDKSEVDQNFTGGCFQSFWYISENTEPNV